MGSVHLGTQFYSFQLRLLTPKLPTAKISKFTCLE